MLRKHSTTSYIPSQERFSVSGGRGGDGACWKDGLAGELLWQLGVLTALAEDPRLSPHLIAHNTCTSISGVLAPSSALYKHTAHN